MLRAVPAGRLTHPEYFFWSKRSKVKSEVSNWVKKMDVLGDIAIAKHPDCFAAPTASRCMFIGTVCVTASRWTTWNTASPWKRLLPCWATRSGLRLSIMRSGRQVGRA